jgi:hypothetical protein
VDRLGTENKEHRIFDTVINGKLTEIWSRNETHELGKANGCPDSWWAKIVYDEHEKDEPEIDWIPFIDLGTNRPCFEINIKQSNYTKSKWGETSINGTCKVMITCNTREVYEVRCRDIEYGLAKCQTLITEMCEHSFNFADPESEIGRKVWYYEQPGIIQSLLLDQGCVMIKFDKDAVDVKKDSDNSVIIASCIDRNGFNLSRPWNDNEMEDEWDGRDTIKTDIFDHNIYWFRD